MYSYTKEKPSLFTEDGQVMFLTIRDNVQRLIKEAGAVRVQEGWTGVTGSTWQMMACFDRMVELGEITEITGKDCMGQHRIFTE